MEPNHQRIPFDDNRKPFLSALSYIDGHTNVPLFADPATGGLIVSATISSVGIATSTNQINGSQKTQIVDGSGNAVTVTGNKLDVNATASLAGTSLPISSATTAVGVAIVDSSGNQISSFGGGTQYADGASRGTATGTLMMVDDGTNMQSASGNTSGEQIVQSKQNGSWSVTSNAGTNLNTSLLALESGGNLATIAGKDFATQTTLSALNAKVTAVNTGAVVVSSSALPTGASTSVKQPALGTAGTASSDVLTVQGIASMTALKVDGSAVTQPVSGTFWQATQPVSGTLTANIGTTNGLALDTSVTGLQVTQGSTTSGQKGSLTQGAVTTSAPSYTTAQTSPLSLDTSGNLRTSVNNTVTVSGTVTANAGTNLNTSTLALESGGNLATLAGAVTSSVVQSNVKQINGVVPLMGNGVTGTGSQRVTIASDNTAFSVNATLGAETTKVIGVVRNADGSGNLLTSTTNALDVNLKTSSITLPVSLTSTTVTGTVAVTESGTWNVGSSSATGSSVPANAFYEGLIAKTANPSAASDGNLVGALADKLGKQVVVGSIRDLKGNQFTTISSSTSETTVITAVASTFLDVYGCIIENTSATASKVTFKDSTAGTTQFEIYVPAGDTRGFMLPESGAFKQTTVNTNWTATCGTSVASIVITMLYVKNI